MIGKYDQNITFISSVVKLCVNANIVIGVLVTIIYCGIIDYYPSGLTIGDSLFFIAASLAFALTYTVMVLALLCAGITFSPVMRALQSIVMDCMNYMLKIRRKPAIIFKINFPVIRMDSFALVFIGLSMIALNVISYSKDFDKAFGLSGAIVAMAFLYGLWNTKPRRKEYNEKSIRNFKIGLAAAIYLIPLIMFQLKGNYLNQSMSMIGVRIDSSIIQVSKKYKEFLVENGVKPDKTTTTGEGVYKDVMIVFRGIGTNVVVSVNGFSLVIPNKEIIIGKGNSG